MTFEIIDDFLEKEDLDGDGIEDAYDEDIDGDGYSNEQEITEGTDP